MKSIVNVVSVIVYVSFVLFFENYLALIVELFSAITWIIFDKKFSINLVLGFHSLNRFHSGINLKLWCTLNPNVQTTPNIKFNFLRVVLEYTLRIYNIIKVIIFTSFYEITIKVSTGLYKQRTIIEVEVIPEVTKPTVAFVRVYWNRLNCWNIYCLINKQLQNCIELFIITLKSTFK